MLSVQPERRSTWAERISQRYFITFFVAASVVSKYTHPCGLRNSIFVSFAPGKLTVLFSSNVPAPWWAKADALMATAARANMAERIMIISRAQHPARGEPPGAETPRLSYVWSPMVSGWSLVAGSLVVGLSTDVSGCAVARLPWISTA